MFGVRGLGKGFAIAGMVLAMATSGSSSPARCTRTPPRRRREASGGALRDILVTSRVPGSFGGRATGTEGQRSALRPQVQSLKTT